MLEKFIPIIERYGKHSTLMFLAKGREYTRDGLTSWRLNKLDFFSILLNELNEYWQSRNGFAFMEGEDVVMRMELFYRGGSNL